MSRAVCGTCGALLGSQAEDDNPPEIGLPEYAVTVRIGQAVVNLGFLCFKCQVTALTKLQVGRLFTEIIKP